MTNYNLRANITALALLTVLVGCAGPASAPSNPGGAGSGPAGTQGNTPTGVLRIAWPTEPEVLSAKLGAGGGVNEFYWVFNSFLTYRDFSGAAHPMIARELPSQERGDWVVNPDGTMVTTYRLRENARWHDGAALTARDFVFAHEVYLDPDIPVRDRVPETLISRVEAQDDRTLVLYWKEPYIQANTLGYQQLDPLPRHLLEEKFRTNKGNFMFGEEWTTGYIGSGPFKVERWVPGSEVVGRANTDWVLGAPKVEIVDIKVMSEATTQLANLLSDNVDVLNSPGIRAPEAAIARDQLGPRGEVYVKTWQSQIRFLAFQFREVPNWQRAISDVRVRQAVMHATDRQGLADVLTHGLGSGADFFLTQSDPVFSEADRVARKYPFDVNRALPLLAEAGWRPAQPGGLVADSGGRTLDLDLWTTSGGGGEQEAAIITDSWRAAGINSGIFMIPAARQRDNELRASFPSVSATARSLSADNFVFTSTQLPTVETRWQGANRGSFRDADVDRLQSIVLTSFDEGERRRATVDLQRRMADLVGIGPLYYSTEVVVARSRVRGPIGEFGGQSGVSWNIFEWDVGG